MDTIQSDYDSIADELLKAHYPQVHPNEIPYILEKHASRSIDGKTGFFYVEIHKALSEKLLSKKYLDQFTQKQSETFRIVAEIDGVIFFIATTKEHLETGLIIVQNSDRKQSNQIIKFEDFVSVTDVRYANRAFNPKIKVGDCVKSGDVIGSVTIELYTHKANLYRSILTAVKEHGEKKIDSINRLHSKNKIPNKKAHSLLMTTFFRDQSDWEIVQGLLIKNEIIDDENNFVDKVNIRLQFHALILSLKNNRYFKKLPTQTDMALILKQMFNEDYQVISFRGKKAVPHNDFIERYYFIPRKES